ncbi:hypothetical protein BKA82DRAFT_4010401 [Pisolithus tinctorius]|nr:hypothetical protein BKA82DRAFT_4010401 [Pisolithus tinctorius]
MYMCAGTNASHVKRYVFGKPKGRVHISVHSSIRNGVYHTGCRGSRTSVFRQTSLSVQRSSRTNNQWNSPVFFNGTSLNPQRPYLISYLGHVLSGALDSGLAVSVLVIFFTPQYPMNETVEVSVSGPSFERYTYAQVVSVRRRPAPGHVSKAEDVVQLAALSVYEWENDMKIDRCA